MTAIAVNQTQIILNWALGSDNTTGILVTRASSATGPFSPVATLNTAATTFTDTGLSPLTAYYYQITARNYYGVSAAVSTAVVTTLSYPPAAPTLLVAANIGQTQLTLNWIDNSNDENEFRIERATDMAGPFALISTQNANTTTFTDIGLTASTAYHYKIFAYSTVGGISVATNTLTVTTAAIPVVPPNSPSGLRAIAVSSGQINLNWADNSNDETGFKVERSFSRTGTYSQIFSTLANTTQYSDIGLLPSTTYYYKLKSFNAIGDSAATTIEFATTSQQETTAPSAPGNLALTGQTSSQMNLTWVDNSNNESGFKIERSLSVAGPYSEVGSVSAGVITFTNTGLTASTSYSYRVLSYNSIGSSVASNIATSATLGLPPSAPTALAATAASPSEIRLSWTDNTSNESGFKIERAANAAGPFSVVMTTFAGISVYADAGLNSATTYYYRVSAVNSGGQSGYSNVTTATTFGTFTWINANVTQPSCIECHSGVRPKGSYDMSTYASVLTRILPGNATSSLLYQQVLDGSMPKTGSLNTNQINAIKTWINSGAPNN